MSSLNLMTPMETRDYFTRESFLFNTSFPTQPLLTSSHFTFSFLSSFFSHLRLSSTTSGYMNHLLDSVYPCLFHSPSLLTAQTQSEPASLESFLFLVPSLISTKHGHAEDSRSSKKEKDL